MSVENAKRFDRVVAILIQLQSRKIVTAGELANRFDVSVRTVYRDIRSLEAAGIPISSEAGIGYSIMDGYRLPPVMFTREEAGSFVAAEKLMQKFTDKALGAYFESAMFKIKSVLRGREKDWISTLESQVSIHGTSELFNDTVPDALEILFESIGEKKQVSLLYQSLESDHPIQRKIEPVGLFHENNFWYIYGYCHLRKDYRQFRTDRLQKIHRTQEYFTLHHGTMDEYREKRERQKLTLVRICVAPTIARYLRYSRNNYGFVSERRNGNQIEMTFESRDLENGFARWYMMFGDYATILEPDHLRNRVRELIQKSASNLS